jgi:hypothetical protein
MIMGSILVIGLIWIYFQIPNIKAKTAPPNGIVSSRDEWIEARSSANNYSLLWSLMGIACAYLRWKYTASEGFDPIAVSLNSVIIITFLMVFATQFMNSKISTKHINN